MLSGGFDPHHWPGKAITANAALMKNVNKNLVLNLIWQQDSTTRAEISRTTGLNRATVSALVQDLIAEGLVREVGPRPATVGRRPVQLEFNEQHRYGIGVEIGVNCLRAAVVDLKGSVAAISEEQTEPTLTGEALLNRIAILVRSVLAKTTVPRGSLLGIGVGVPGVCDRHDGVVKWSNSLRWQGFPLRNLLSEKTGLPVEVENQAYLGAYGEAWLGAARSSENVVYVSAGYGIGAGVLIQRQLYLGSQGFAGRVGHLSIAFDGPRCGCGNQGCWELFASERATIERGKQVVRSPGGAALKMFLKNDELKLSLLMAAAEAGIESAREILAETGKYLGVGIAGLITAFNPDLLVVGNSIAECGEWVLEPMRKEIRSRQISNIFGHIEICTGTLHERAALLGAAYLLFAERYNLSIGRSVNALETMVSARPLADRRG